MTFQELMDSYYISEEDNNQITYNKLLTFAQTKNITPVIGAGLSHWAYPLWKEMLEQQGKNYGLTEEISSLLKDSQYEKAASLLEKELTHNGMTHLLKQIFRSSLLEEKISNFPEYLKKIPILFTGPIITTNFDRAIEFIFHLTNTKLPDMVIPSDDFQSGKIKESLQQNTPLLIKMHGDIKDIEHLIFTEESYNAAYGNNTEHPDFTKEMPKFLQKIIERSPLLFLGCSLESDRTCTVIKNCALNCQLFAFIELPKETKNPDNNLKPLLKNNNKLIKEFKDRYQNIVGNLNIQPIWYPYHMHQEAFDIFFTKLSEDLHKVHISNSLASYRLINHLPKIREVFFGRDQEIEKIHTTFQSGTRTLFLQGIGGIGKSELAKNYALKYQDSYNHIIFTNYTSSLKELICNPNAIQIENLMQAPNENDNEFFQRKLHILQNLSNEKTLLIIDNFDVKEDPDLEGFLEGNYCILFTTRYPHTEYKTIPVENINNIEDLRKIFIKNTSMDIKEEELSYLNEIFEFVGYHTYAIELIAKQMVASFLTPKTMLELLKKRLLPTVATENIIGKNGQKPAFEHIRSLFNLSNLNEKEKQIMMYLSLIGIQGIQATHFKEWAELPSYEVIHPLIHNSWIRTENNQLLSLHPLVKEVVYSELHPSIENCRIFLENIAGFCCGAWMRNYQENIPITNNILEILSLFEPNGKEIQIFEPIIGFLWQIGKFDDSIHYFHILYNSCLKEYGENSNITGVIAKSLGGAYFNSGDLLSSIPWYKQALYCMQLTGNEDREDFAMAYEKVARCYTWEYEQDLKKAKEYFEIALEMRYRIKTDIKCGKVKTRLIDPKHYTLNEAESTIGETYMEMGRMYQVSKEYKKALEYSKIYENSLLKFQPFNLSGLAYAYCDQGMCYYYLGLQEKEQGNSKLAIENWLKSEEYLAKALESNINMRGAIAVDTIDNQEYLADVHNALSKEMYEKALEEYTTALQMTENLIGPNCKKAQTIKQKLLSSTIDKNL